MMVMSNEKGIVCVIVVTYYLNDYHISIFISCDRHVIIRKQHNWGYNSMCIIKLLTKKQIYQLVKKVMGLTMVN